MITPYCPRCGWMLIWKPLGNGRIEVQCPKCGFRHVYEVRTCASTSSNGQSGSGENTTY